MSENSKTNLYIDHIKSYILPFIDYSELQQSYETDMVYAKGVLNRLHITMGLVYGGETLSEMNGMESDVVVPGIVRGKESGKLCIALLTLDLSSSGEHWGTDYLCKYGVISQDGNSPIANNDSVLASEVREINAAYLPYDYGYTATIPDDIHVDFDDLHYQIKDVLNDFRNHHAELLYKEDAVQGDRSVDDGAILSGDFNSRLGEAQDYITVETLKAGNPAREDNVYTVTRAEIQSKFGADITDEDIREAVFERPEVFSAEWQGPELRVVPEDYYLERYHIRAEGTPAQAALNEPDIFEDEATAALRERLIERLDGNLSEYFDIIRKLDNKEAAAWSFEIADMTGAYHYLTELHNFHASELNYLLQFQNPLKIVADKFEAVGMDDRSDIMWDIFDGQDALEGDYERMPDTTAADVLKQELFDRLDTNMLDYRTDILGASKETIFDMSEDIAAHYAAREYMKTAYDYKTGEVEYLLQFQDPLSLVAESWLVATDHFFTVGDVVTGVFEDKDSHGHFARVMDADNPAAKENAKVSGAEKPSVLERIRAAEKEPKPPRKDKTSRDKSKPEH